MNIPPGEQQSTARPRPFANQSAMGYAAVPQQDLPLQICVCVCVCVRERDRDRERESVCMSFGRYSL